MFLSLMYLALYPSPFLPVENLLKNINRERERDMDAATPSLPRPQSSSPQVSDSICKGKKFSFLNKQKHKTPFPSDCTRDRPAGGVRGGHPSLRDGRVP